MLPLARAIVAGAQCGTLDPPDHPAVGQALSRLAPAIARNSSGSAFSIGMTPAALRFVPRFTIAGDVPITPRTFLNVLAIDAAEHRSRGGPAQIWAAEGDLSTVIEHENVLGREQRRAPVVAFEHHLKQDLSGYPVGFGGRKLNLCTMILSIAGVFDAVDSDPIDIDPLTDL